MKRKLIDKSNKLTLEVDEWFDYVEKYLSITVDDIRSLKEGQSESFLFIDRNFLDVLSRGINDIEEELFIYDKFYSGKYTRKNKDSLKGTFEYGGKLKGDVNENFEFHVMIEEAKMWYPLHNDYTLTDICLPGVKEYIGIHSSKLEGSRKIGWRGVCVRYSDVNKILLLLIN
jgi:hypothetical protein